MNSCRSIVLALLRLLLAFVGLWLAGLAFQTLFIDERNWLAASALLLCGAVLLTELRLRRYLAQTPRWRRLMSWVTLAICLLGMINTVRQGAELYWSRSMILRSPPQVFRSLGQHLVVGFTSEDDVSYLARNGLIGGIYIGRRNVQGRTPDDIRQLIGRLQKLRQDAGLPALWVMADQEGGRVSHLSPPLPMLAPLSQIVREIPDPQARVDVVYGHAALQGRQLAGLGVNVNLSPVVDLNHGVRNPNDMYSRISERAIGSSPALVTDVAADYCRGLALNNVHCTLKHFPGLGRVYGDTHIGGAALHTSLAELERSDWVPFRQLMRMPGVLTMVGHARLTALDAERPASYSPAVIGLLRQRWGFQGLLITDDFCMQAVLGSKEGIGEAAVQSLNAGVDLILITRDPEQFYPVMRTLLRAQAEGRLDQGLLDVSARRLRARGLPNDRG